MRRELGGKLEGSKTNVKHSDGSWQKEEPPRCLGGAGGALTDTQCVFKKLNVNTSYRNTSARFCRDGSSRREARRLLGPRPLTRSFSVLIYEVHARSAFVGTDPRPSSAC